MGGIILTKKQKQLMRERKRKKKLYEHSGCGDDDDDDVVVETTVKSKLNDDNNNNGTTPLDKQMNGFSDVNVTNVSKKRSRSSSDADVVVSSTNHNNEQKQNAPQLTTTITIPSNLDAKGIKKFRKDTKRKVKNHGQNPDEIIFVIEGEVKKQQEEEKLKHEEESPPPKKWKRTFPCIKELVATQQREQKKQQQQNGDVYQSRNLKLNNNITDVSMEYKSKYIAIDCEMVGIGPNAKQSALARISIVDWDLHVLLDTYVKVPGKVTDFRTWVSGVKPKHIKSDKAINLQDCRKLVTTILQNKILVGHGLKNDLNALLLTHPKESIRDTTKYRLFQKMIGLKYKPRKLRDLVKEFCNRTIQQDGEAHNSIDDAIASMELFKVVHHDWEREIELKLLKSKQTKK